MDAKILDKVKKLLTLADRGGTEHEAAAAAAAAQRLMTAHRLELADIAFFEGTDSDPFVEQDDDLDPELATRRNRDTWRGVLAGGIANANGCAVWWWGPWLRIAGTQMGCSATRYMYAYLSREVVRLSKDVNKGMGKGWSTAWKLGCAMRLAERLEAETIAVIKSAASKNALVHISKEIQRVEDFIAKQGGMQAASEPTVSNKGAFVDGYMCGNAVNIDSGPSLDSGAKGSLR